MNKIHIIGLGSGNSNEIPFYVIDQIKNSGTFYVRTKDIPVIDEVRKQGVDIQTFDDIYEAHEQFEDVYQEICQKLLQLAAENEEIWYGVPGHPRVAERTVALLLTTKPEGIEIIIEGGHSFIDQVFTSFGFDPIEGFTLLDGTLLNDAQINPDHHMIIAQVYDQLIASDVKITLMNVYPDETFVWVGSYLGTDQEVIRAIPLFELDYDRNWNNFSLIYIPPVKVTDVEYRKFSYLQQVVAILRSPEGCPWDREQTHQSLRNYLIEETYEVLEAIDSEDVDGLQEELGDVLLQVMLHSQIAAEDGYFDIKDVIYSLNEKLIRRHPHVFGNKNAKNTNEVLQNWQEMKNKEKEAKGISTEEHSVLSGIPKGLPAVLAAYQLQKKASAAGFDWDRLEDVIAKVEEEWRELKQSKGLEEKTEELGDFLFSIINLARFLEVDPEEAIAKTNLKFKQRFYHIEQFLQKKGKTFKEISLDEMERLWQEAKKMKKM